MKRHIVSFSLVAMFLAAPLLQAQNDSAFQAWQQAEQKKLQAFRDANDRAFYDFLTKEWRGVELAKGMVKDPIPDLPKLPVYEPPAAKLPAPEAPPVVLPPPPQRESIAVPPTLPAPAGGG